MAQSVLTIVTALFPPARAVETTVNAATAALEVLAVASAAAQEGGQSGEASGAAEARQAAIRVRTAANQLNNAFGDNYAQQLRQDNSHLCSMVGIMILDDNQNDAANTLIREAGIPRPQGNIGRQVLEGMLAEYRRWSRLYAAQHGSIQEAIRYGDRHVEAESNRQAANQAAELLPD